MFQSRDPEHCGNTCEPKEEMCMQKRYHIAKRNRQIFSKGGQVYVFFPLRKTGHSHNIASFWRGQYTIVRKKSDFLYKVDCGPCGKPQVIIADRIQLRKPQPLANEVNYGVNDNDVALK
jgi:hypothetical protein